MTNIPFIYQTLKTFTTMSLWCSEFERRKAFGFAVTTKTLNVAITLSRHCSLAALTITPSPRSLNYSLQFSSCAIWNKQESYCTSFRLLSTVIRNLFNWSHLPISALKVRSHWEEFTTPKKHYLSQSHGKALYSGKLRCRPRFLRNVVRNQGEGKAYTLHIPTGVGYGK